MIRLEHVSKVINGSTIIEDVSMEMKSSVIYGIEGCNGSGKTMLMRLISGLIYPTKGKIYINDHVIDSKSEYPAKLGILIENPAFLGSYSGIENLKILASIRNQVSEAEIIKYIKMVGLDPADKKKYRKYSLGMKQRLGIAAAIMEKPEILILDEPINALDKSGVQIIRDIIIQEKKRGALILLSCHDSEFLKSVSDELFHMEAGVLSKKEGTDV